MFKNLIVYRLAGGWADVAPRLEALLDAAVFVPCGATQPQSSGWVPPRGTDHGPLVEIVGGHHLLMLMTERRLLPGAVVKQRIDELAAIVERETGRKPGRKLKAELKDQAVQALLPQAFTKRSTCRLWIDPAQQRLMVEASSATRADEAVTLLVQALQQLVVAPLITVQSPAAVMAGWLLDEEPPAVFSVDRDCELKAADESQAVVRYARHRLDIDEVREHIRAGKRPTRLALTWQGRVSFALGEGGQLKKLDFLDVVFEDRPSGLKADEAFDADAAIATGELSRLLPDLVDALGGEQPAAGAEPAPLLLAA